MISKRGSMERLTRENIREIVTEMENKMRCCCDLDNWQPESTTGHTWVCRIHQAAIERWESINHGIGA